MRTTIVQRKTVDANSAISPGSVIEVKRGLGCLRMADAIRAQANGRWRVTRTWLKPGRFDPGFY